jgi:hypothetical protein
MKFKLKEDWNTETTFLGKKMIKKMYDKGHIFEPVDTLYEIIHYSGEEFKLSESEMKTLDIFEEMTQKSDEFEIVIEEIPEDDDNLVRNWRIQLDVKTTRKKLNQVKILIEEYIKPIL